MNFFLKRGSSRASSFYFLLSNSFVFLLNSSCFSKISFLRRSNFSCLLLKFTGLETLLKSTIFLICYHLSNSSLQNQGIIFCKIYYIFMILEPIVLKGNRLITYSPSEGCVIKEVLVEYRKIF